MTSRAATLAFAALLLLSAGFAALLSQRAAAAPRNILLITLDTTRADHLGCYGATASTSPRIDAVAARGALFTNAFCAASVTPVSHASILTGRYPYRHGLRVLHGRTENVLPPGARTLPEVLADSGYATAAFVSAFPAGSRFGLDQGFDVFEESFLGTVEESEAINTAHNQRRAGETTDLALRWMGGVEDPFFLWVHYFDPHDPVVLPPEDFLAEFHPPTGSPQEQFRALYDLEVRYMDQQLGRVLDALESSGRLDNTVVVIVSDHGEGLGDHGWWTHGILYQEQIRAPLIIRAPNRAPARIDHVVRSVDLMPTVLELAGIDAGDTPDMDGRSLVPMLDGTSPDPGRIAYADSINMLTYGVAEGISDVKNDMLLCVTDGRWKYIHHLIRESESELYDLATDPGELNNLYAQRPEVVERLRDDLAARDFMPDEDHGRGWMSNEDVKRLRSLGYLR